MQVNKQQLEPDMKQQTGSKSGKENVKAVYYHPAYLTYVHHVKCWAGWNTSWNQDCQEKYKNLRYSDNITLMAESEEELKSLLMKVRGELKNLA